MAAYGRAFELSASELTVDSSARRGKLGSRAGRDQFVRVAERLVKYANSRAITRKLEFDIDPQWVFAEMAEADFRCVLTGLPFVIPKAAFPRSEPFAPSLDRMDCAKGYTRNNVRIILLGVNVALNAWGTESLLQISRALVRTQRRRAA